VFGAGHDAVPVVAQAAQLGFRTVVVDDRRQFLTSERFPEAHELVHAVPGELARAMRPDSKTAVVLMSHNYLRDLDALESLLGTETAYIGALGPGERLQRMLTDLAARGSRGDGSGSRQAARSCWTRHRGRRAGRDRLVGDGRGALGAAREVGRTAPLARARDRCARIDLLSTLGGPMSPEAT
jgi:hypothetical protein